MSSSSYSDSPASESEVLVLASDSEPDSDSDDVEFECATCFQAFGTAAFLQAHETSHPEASPVPSPEHKCECSDGCEQDRQRENHIPPFMTLEKRRQHRAMIREMGSTRDLTSMEPEYAYQEICQQELKCEICLRVFATAEHVLRHTLMWHPDANAKPEAWVSCSCSRPCTIQVLETIRQRLGEAYPELGKCVGRDGKPSLFQCDDCCLAFLELVDFRMHVHELHQDDNFDAYFMKDHGDPVATNKPMSGNSYYNNMIKISQGMSDCSGLLTCVACNITFVNGLAHSVHNLEIHGGESDSDSDIEGTEDFESDFEDEDDESDTHTSATTISATNSARLMNMPSEANAQLDSDDSDYCCASESDEDDESSDGSYSDYCRETEESDEEDEEEKAEVVVRRKRRFSATASPEPERKVRPRVGSSPFAQDIKLWLDTTQARLRMMAGVQDMASYHDGCDSVVQSMAELAAKEIAISFEEFHAEPVVERKTSTETLTISAIARRMGMSTRGCEDRVEKMLLDEWREKHHLKSNVFPPMPSS